MAEPLQDERPWDIVREEREKRVQALAERDHWAKMSNEWADTHVENCRRIWDLEAERDRLAEVAEALEKMVRGEYPDRYALAEIAKIWGPEFGLSDEQVGAVAHYEALRDG